MTGGEILRFGKHWAVWFLLSCLMWLVYLWVNRHLTIGWYPILHHRPRTMERTQNGWAFVWGRLTVVWSQ